MGYLRFISSLALCALLLSAETDYRFAFPQSEILMGVDIKWLVKSPFGEQMKGSVKANLGDLKPLEEFLDNIDSVYVSAVSKPGVVKAGAAKSNGSDLLLLVKGRFDMDKLVALGQKNGFKLDQWGNTKVLLQPLAKKPLRAPANGPVAIRKASFVNTQFSPLDAAKQQRPFFALYDSKTVIIGEEGPLRVALERMDGGLVPQANPLMDRARNLEAANDFWIVGSMAPLNLEGALGGSAKGAKPGNDPFSSLAREIRNFSIGVAVRRDVALDFQLQASSPKVATQMHDMLKGLMAMQKATAKPEEALPFDIDKALQLSASGSIFRASLTLEQKELEQIIASPMVAAFAGANGAAVKQPGPQGAPKQMPKVETASAAPQVVTPAPVVVPAKPIEPVRKTVMIYGLPGGPKEVPVTNR